jgi:hypothetical protein
MTTMASEAFRRADSKAAAKTAIDRLIRALGPFESRLFRAAMTGAKAYIPTMWTETMTPMALAETPMRWR